METEINFTQKCTFLQIFFSRETNGNLTFVKMAIDKHLRDTIATFYQVHHDKGKLFTYENFKQAAPKHYLQNLEVF